MVVNSTQIRNLTVELIASLDGGTNQSNEPKISLEPLL